MCGLAINIASFAHLLKRVDFDATVDHLVLTHISKSKAESAITRIERLLEILSSYSFNLYYIKSKDMILSDFLSRQKHDNSNPHEIIPILFNMQNILHSRYYNIGKRKEGKYLVQTRSQAKSGGITLPEVHGVNKGIHPNVQAEKQVIIPVIACKAKGTTQNKSRLGQGRAGIKRIVKTQIHPQLSKPIQFTGESILQHPQNIVQPKTSSDSRPHTKYIPVPQPRSGEHSKPEMVSREIPPYSDPIYRPLLNQQKNHYKKFQEN